MTVVSGAVSSFAELQTAIENAAVSAGWSLSSGILSKDGLYCKLTNTSAKLKAEAGTGASGSTVTGKPYADFGQNNALKLADSNLTFPISYDICTFSNPDEVYCVINYNSYYYQALAFGKSDVPGIGGTGMWITANLNDSDNTAMTMRFSISGSSVYCYSQKLPFFFDGSAVGATANAYLNCELDDYDWRYLSREINNLYRFYGTSYCAGLLTSLPSPANENTILIPVKAIAYRNDKGLTIIANPKNVRYCRIDNINPGDIVSFGSDSWKVYPMFRKDVTERNGGYNEDHSGTFGYAIRQ